MDIEIWVDGIYLSATEEMVCYFLLACVISDEKLLGFFTHG
jgi:hypothetical protein